MALPENPITRNEQYLSSIAGEGTELPDYPITRKEKYLAAIAGENVVLPEYPIDREEKYLAYIAENGGGGDITVETLIVTENGTYNPGTGKAYKPVTVNVPDPVLDTLSVTENGTYTPEAGTDGFDEVVVNVQGGGSILPAGYTQMEYLESSGTQIIDTGRVLTMDSEVEITTQWTLFVSTYHSPVGSTSPSFSLSSSSAKRLTQVYYYFGNSGEMATISTDHLPLRAKNTMKINSTQMVSSAEGVTLFSYDRTSTTEVVGSTTSYIFGRNKSTVDYWTGRIYDFVWKESGVVVQHLIPAMRNADNVLGMYDIISDTFLTNIGTGEFIGGELA